MVPGSFGWGSVVFEATTTFAPSAAARNAIALPMPRLAPVMNRVLPLRFAMVLLPSTLQGRRPRRHQLVDPGGLFVGDLDIHGSQAVFELLDGARTDDVRGHRGVSEHPGIGEAGEGDAFRFRERDELLDDVQAALELGVFQVSDPLFGARAVLGIAGVPAVLAREPAAFERAPDDVADPEFLRHGKVLELHHPAQDAVRRLERDEPLETLALGDPEGLDDLPGGEALLPERGARVVVGRKADVADL